MADSFGDLVCLGDEQGTWTGDPHRHETLIVWIARGEASFGEKVADQRTVCELGRRESDVGVGGVWGDGEVSVAGVKVDRLRVPAGVDRRSARTFSLSRSATVTAGVDVSSASNSTRPG